MPAINCAFNRLTAGICLAAAAVASGAATVEYQFTTATMSLSTHPVLGALIGGASADGTLLYDNQAPLVATSGATSIYGSAVLGLRGSLGGHAFSDGAGSAVAGNNAYQPPIPTPPPAVDLYVLSSDTPVPDLSGFSLGDFQLVRVRLFWIAANTGEADFLDDNSLLAELPVVPGMVAFDFIDTSAGGALAGAFFPLQTLQPSPVPLPAGLLPFALALVGFCQRRIGAAC